MTGLSAKLILGDVRETITHLDAESVQSCITSPPYWGLRDYGSENQIGQESTPEEYVESLVSLFREIRRVLRGDGTVWLNIGDTYVGTGDKGKSKDPKAPKNRNGQTIALNHKVAGLKSKDMIGIPWKVAFALQADGWFLRSDIIWSKSNVLPSPVKDRPVSSYEHLFLFSKSRKYYYDYKAVQEERVDGKGKRSQRDVWNIKLTPIKDADSHVAVYPKELVLPCILAGSKEGDTILDPFSGSGTTGIVAIANDRNYIGCEANSDYVKLSEKRFTKELIDFNYDFSVVDS